MPLRAVGLVLAVSVSTVAVADNHARYVSAEGGFVIVWNSSDDLWLGFKLIEAGMLKANPDSVTRLMACVVRNGTEVSVTEPGLLVNEVVVVSEENAGCRGAVSIDRMSSEVKE